MKFIDEKNVKEIQLELLEYINEICTENKIMFSLCGGTLLGAIRHNGYIPWDDDIDVFFVREEYERFKKAVISDNKYDFVDIFTNPYYYYQFAKLSKRGTVLKANGEKYIKDEKMGFGVYVDVFVVDGLPDGLNNRMSKLKSVSNAWLDVLCYQGFSVVNEECRLKSLLKKIQYFPRIIKSKIVGRDKLVEKFSNVCSFPLPTETSKAGVFLSIYGEREFLDSSVFYELENHDFERYSLPILQRYDVYLGSLYGKYMELPPVEKRIGHHPYSYYWED